MKEEPQTVIDAHLHLWDRSYLAYPWMSDMPRLPHSSLPTDSDTLMSDANTGTSFGAIVIEAGARQDQSLAEVEWVSELARRAPAIRGIVAAVDLTDSRLEVRLDQLRSNPLVVGVRDNFEGRPLGELDVRASNTARRLQLGVETVLAAGMTFDVCVRSEQLGELTPFIHAIAQSRGSAAGIVIDHLGKPMPDDSEAANDRWASELRELARIPGLHIKFSGLPGQIPGMVDAARARTLADAFADEVINAFSVERTMFGTDHPVSTLGHRLGAGDWERAVAAAFTERVDDDGVEAIMGATAARFYGLRSRS